ncbi:cytochrome c3 family protein [Malonomonas rubra]|uniref:cytochrome c3 family protein n=1 Tax=Malonomonas rubra TaxID=57040 RepID=UPI0026F069B6|nr:cytochrome c3 family protein [Malonomonas rubra]
MKKILTLIAAVSLVSLSALTAIAENKGPEEIKIPASMGDITFNHAKHQASITDCTTCHHAGVEAGACKSCHGEKPEAPKAKKVFHQLCKDCHEKESGPTKCKACHVK